MLNFDGENISSLYYQGNQIGMIYLNGRCIYPGHPTQDHDAIFQNGSMLSDFSEVENEITSITRADALPTNITPIIISYSNVYHDCIIYAWVDGSTIYWYCLTDNVYTDDEFSIYTAYSSNINEYLTDISSLSEINLSRATNLRYGLADHYTLSDISPVANWDVSNVTNFEMCFWDTHIYDLDALVNWNMSSARSFESMFSSCNYLSDISAIANWDVSHVRIMNSMFEDCSSLTTIPELNWNTASVTDIESMFARCTNLVDISGISDFDVSNVTIFNGLFRYCNNLSDISPIANWDINPEVFSISYLFQGTNVTDFTPLYNWAIPYRADALYGLSKITSIDFNRFTKVAANSLHLIRTFDRCSDLTICDLGDKCSLIETPGSYYYHSEGVFNDTSALKTLIIRNTSLLEIENYRSYYSYVFQSSGMRSNDAKLYVPQNLISDYTNNTRWKYALLNYGCQILPLEGSPYEQPGSL